MKRAFAVAIILALLITALAGILLVRTGLANPVPWWDPARLYLPTPNPANIDVQSPQGNTSYKGNNVLLRVSVTNLADIRRIYCYLDGRQITASPVGFFTLFLTDLSEGPHTIKVSVSNQKVQELTGYYSDFSEGHTRLVRKSEIVYSAVVWSHSEVSFTVDNTSPQILVLSPLEQTYGTEALLDFEVDESTSRVAYSLDGRENVTVAGSTLLSGLSEGGHSVTVYAWDTAGNVGASETITFTVAVAEPFPTTWIVAAIVLIAVVGAALLVYFRRIKKNKRELGELQ
ncbi:MAG: hypothetical protein OEZ18_00570 [Candidatus Bathyarchaeota archaeon]|nr:hypothetical protein [Candidatus Bathyarchaeota archaeon]MDH5793042.1 hypothetical protein [Candidatus Bathyarchaeota archaeon]